MKSLVQFSSLACLILSSSLVSAKKYDIISAKASGNATIVSREKGFSTVNIKVDRINDELTDDLDRGDVLEAWLVDHGTATDADFTSSNDDDNDGAFEDASSASDFSISGVTVPDVPVIDITEASPYALSLGTLKKDGSGNYTLSFKTRNTFKPYDYLMITQESKGNQGDYDPRPGTQLTTVDIDFR